MAEHIEVFNHQHNWSSAMVENFEFKTDIITSQSGREQRRSLRRNPRLAIETRINPFGAALIKLRRQLTFWGQYPFWHPDWVRFTEARNDVSVGVSEIPITRPLAGARPGMLVVLQMPSGSAPTFALTGVSAASLKLDGPLLELVPAGTTVHLAYRGYLPAGQQSQLPTDRVATMSCRFEADPISELPLDPGAAVQSFMGIEVVELRPNWQKPVEVVHDYAVYDVDNGRGPIKRYHPVSYNSPTAKWSMRNMDRARSEAVLSFFLRMKGRLRVCYVPSLIEDLTAKSALLKGSDKIKVIGLEAMQYWDGAVQRALRIETKDGQVLYRRVISMAQSGSDTEVRVDTPWPAELAAGKISWMSRCRLASDLLVLSWLSETISECDLTFTTLEDPQ